MEESEWFERMATVVENLIGTDPSRHGWAMWVVQELRRIVSESEDAETAEVDT